MAVSHNVGGTPSVGQRQRPPHVCVCLDVAVVELSCEPLAHGHWRQPVQPLDVLRVLQEYNGRRA